MFGRGCRIGARTTSGRVKTLDDPDALLANALAGHADWDAIWQWANGLGGPKRPERPVVWYATIRRVQIHPAPAPDHVVESWQAAVDDAGIDIEGVALIWRPGRPRPTGQEAASRRPDCDIDPEFDDDHEFIRALDWANGGPDTRSTSGYGLGRAHAGGSRWPTSA